MVLPLFQGPFSHTITIFNLQTIYKQAEHVMLIRNLVDITLNAEKYYNFLHITFFEFMTNISPYLLQYKRYKHNEASSHQEQEVTN